jgi:hypothetical protein
MHPLTDAFEEPSNACHGDGMKVDHPSPRSRTRGDLKAESTLIDLSIVVVILGLMVGGVMRQG